MSLSAGSRLGPYEIVSMLGAGGMGEVYRARDTRLQRTVALKVIHPDVAGDPARHARFEREAKAVSSLNHPHIGALYDVGQQDGVDFLVMEYVEGETLAQRLSDGPLGLEQTLKLGAQMAEALHAAHRQGIVHRDLKPGNVMLTRSGVKLLDFGLAKLRPEEEAESEPGESTFTRGRTCERPLTDEGVVMGTVPYMAPEQLEGRPADARTDIFALGAVLHEMATGERAFKGKSRASLIAAILKEDPPPVSSLQPLSPPVFDRLVRTCLAKDPDERWQSAHDLAAELRWVAEGGSQARLLAAAPARRLARWWLAAAAALMLVAVGAMLWPSRPSAPAASDVVHFTVLAPAMTALATFDVMHRVTVSPDGQRLAFVAASEGVERIWVQPLSALGALPLPGTENARNPFWSPDGRFIAFLAKGMLKKVDVAGGSPRTLCEAAGPWIAGTWSVGGTIVFDLAEVPEREGLYRVPAEGGEPVRLRPVAESQLVLGAHPHFLPDGKRYLFLAKNPQGQRSLYVASLESEGARLISPMASRVEYAASGHLLYARDGVLVAQPFDETALRFTGEPAPVADSVGFMGATANADFSVSQRGVVVYRGAEANQRLAWLDRQGHEEYVFGGAGAYANLHLSRDGTRLAVEVTDPRTGPDLWTYDMRSRVGTRLTSSPDDEPAAPIWSPDGSRIVYSAGKMVTPNLRLLSLGGEAEELLPPSGRVQFASDWSADGRFVAYAERDPRTDWDVWMLAIADRKPIALVRTPYREHSARFSPDGRWIAFVSDESGQHEVYVQPLSGRGARVRISTAGGATPRWRRDGRELFYLARDKRLMSVPVAGADALRFGMPTALFRNDALVWVEGTGDDYDVSADGQRFVVILVPSNSPPPAIQVILNSRALVRQ